jgi:hypothetical protein
MHRIRRFAMNSNLRKLEIICFGLLFLSVKVSAPNWNSLTIIEFSPVQPYSKLEYAIGMIETKGDTLAYNPLEEAIGIFQIRPIRIIDYNRRTGSSISRHDLYNFETSEKIFLYYASLSGPYKLEQIARNWNGSGKRTSFYWDRVKEFMARNPCISPI